MLRIILIIAAVILAVFFIAEQFKTVYFLRHFGKWEIGDHCILGLSDKEMFVKIVAFNFDDGLVIVQELDTNKAFVVTEKVFLSIVREISEKEEKCIQ